MFMKPKYFLGLLCFAGAVAGADTAFCQTTEERAGARAAADRGYDAFKAGDWADALDLFERAESLVHSPVQALYIARCHARLGHLIEAQEAYLKVVREGMSPGASASMRAARKEAEEELIPLEPQIPIVTLIVEGQTRGALEVQQDGRVVPPALLGVARPLNPGEHTWQASSGSRRSTVETRMIEAGTQTTITLRLPEGGAEEVAASADPDPMASPEATMSTADGPSGWVYAGFGLAVTGLAIGTGFLLYQGSLEDRIDCNAGVCPGTSSNRELKSRADRAGAFSAIGFATGGIGLVSALAIWALEPGSDPGPETGKTTLRVQPWVGWNSAGVTGSF
jgi:hypothetical protein